jgi:hypothetical protein
VAETHSFAKCANEWGTRLRYSLLHDCGLTKPKDSIGVVTEGQLLVPSYRAAIVGHMCNKKRQRGVTCQLVLWAQRD